MRKREKQRTSSPAAILFVCAIFFAVVPSMSAWGADTIKDINRQEINQVFNALFEALEVGDTPALQGLMGEEMYKKNKALLEQNAGYPEFLRNYYQGASFEVDEIAPDGEKILAGFTINFPDGRQQTVYLNLAASPSDGMQSRRVTGSSEPTEKKWRIINNVDAYDLKGKTRPVQKGAEGVDPLNNN